MENVYSGDVSKEMLLANYQPSWCKCETKGNGGDCGSDCTNRRNRVECDPTLCVAGDKCGNQVRSEYETQFEKLGTKNDEIR